MKLSFKKSIDFWLGSLVLFCLFVPVRIVGLLLRRKHQLELSRHICVIKLLGGGSLFMILPSLQAIKQKYPDKKISILCSKGTFHFAKAFQVFDEVRVIDDQSLFGLFVSGLKNLWWLRTKVDTTIDLEVHSRLTTVLTTLALIRNRIGLINQNSLWRKRIYTHAIYVNLVQSLYDSYEAVAALFGITNLLPQASQTELKQKLSSLAKDKTPKSDQLNICLGLGCSDLALERMMDIKLWAELLEKISQSRAVHFFFLGGARDAELAEALFQNTPRLRELSTNLCGQLKVEESMAVIDRAQAFLGIDSALIHIARFLAVPTVSFFGPTSPHGLLRKLPILEQVHYSSVYCSPCVHLSESPPCHGQNICMNHQNRFQDVVQFLAQIQPGHLNKFTKATSYTKFNWIYFPDSSRPRKTEFTVRFS